MIDLEMSERAVHVTIALASIVAGVIIGYMCGLTPASRERRAMRRIFHACHSKLLRDAQHDQTRWFELVCPADEAKRRDIEYELQVCGFVERFGDYRGQVCFAYAYQGALKKKGAR